MMGLAKLFKPLMSPRRRRRGPVARLGLAIGVDRVVAVELGRGLLAPSVRRVHARPLAPPTDDGGWPDLTEALQDLLATLGTERAAASVALLGPLARAKVVRVPTLRRRDLRPLLTRNARRYFLLGTQPVVADGMRVERGRRGQTVAVVATCVNRSRLAAIQESLDTAGVKVDTMTAATFAVIEAVCRRVRAARRATALIAVSSSSWCETIAIRNGTPRLLQPGIGSPSDLEKLATQIRENLGETAPKTETVVLADSESREGIVQTVRRAFDEAPVDWSEFEELDPAAVAAHGAAMLPEDVPLLFTEGARLTRARRIRRRVGTLAAATAVLLGLTAGQYRVGLQREFDAVAAQRREISTQVARALEMRRSVEAVRQRLEAIAGVEEATVDWTPTFAALALALPDSAYLVSMTADGVDLRLAGIAHTAAAVVPALEASPLLSNVSLTVARRSETSPDAERFDVALVLDREGGGGDKPQPDRGNRP